MASFFYYGVNGEKVGPLTPAALKSLAMQGLITPETMIENDSGRSTVAGKVNGLAFPAAAPMPPIESHPFGFSPPHPEGTYSFATSASNPADSAPKGQSPFTLPDSEPVVTQPVSTADIQPIRAELLGMKPELLFVFMYLAALFSFSIVTTFIPVVIWALTKDKDKRADLHGRAVIGLIIVYAVSAILFFAVFFIFSGLDALIFGLPIFIVMLLCLIGLIVGTIYAAYGYVPSNPKDLPGRKIRWIYAPTPIGVPSTPQPASPTTPMPNSPVDEIKKMKDLLDCGAITQEEFNAFKKKALGI